MEADASSSSPTTPATDAEKSAKVLFPPFGLSELLSFPITISSIFSLFPNSQEPIFYKNSELKYLHIQSYENFVHYSPVT